MCRKFNEEKLQFDHATFRPTNIGENLEFHVYIYVLHLCSASKILDSIAPIDYKLPLPLPTNK